MKISNVALKSLDNIELLGFSLNNYVIYTVTKASAAVNVLASIEGLPLDYNSQ